MDDIIDSFETIQIAQKVRENLQIVAKPAGFIIRKWCSNELGVLEGIPEEERAAGVKIGDATLPNVKTLGVWWDANADDFTFTVNWASEEVNTKRQLLSKIATTYDPFQFLAPLMIRGKIALQSAWLAGVDWDEQLPQNIQDTVNRWLEQMNKIQDLRISRCYRQRPLEEVSEAVIHTFCDASKEAYTAVSFIRFHYQDGSIEVSYVASKTRVTPLRAVSIPRLELMAAVLGTRLARIIAKVLSIPIDQHRFWTDSTDVLFWVRNQSRQFKPFITNRVSEIHEHTSPMQWNHVPGKMNPADDPTRGLDVHQMSRDSRWSRGPDFLHLTEEHWPRIEIKGLQQSTEAKIESPKSLENTRNACSSVIPIDCPVIDFNQFFFLLDKIGESGSLGIEVLSSTKEWSNLFDTASR
jgi:hypothetical protein